MSQRIDKELLSRNLANSRTKAQELIAGGYVLVNDKVATKVSQAVEPTDSISILENDKSKYVSRGGLKLEKALDTFELTVSGKKIMDIGSSTGGFTDCALQYGAKHVVAVDVGSNLMNENLRKDPRVELYENTNIKNLDKTIFEDIELITMDVSFISIKQIIDIIANLNIEIELMCLIKPQFECGKQIAHKYKGLIHDISVHKSIVKDITSYFSNLGFKLMNISQSPIKGGDGNIEYISHFSNKINTQGIDVQLAEEIVKSAFKKQ